jgi:hypothetical protein
MESDEIDLPIKALAPRRNRVRRQQPGGVGPGSGRQDSNRVDELERARNSKIYWWYRCLQVNEQYQYCCGSGGAGPLADLYKDFGNVLDLPFNVWWARHGRKAFQERHPFKKVTQITDRWQVDFDSQGNELLVVAIPLNKRKTTAMREIGKLLAEAHDKAHNGQQVDIWKASTSKRQIIKNKVRDATIEQLLKLWMLRLANPQAKLYELGPMAGIVLTHQAWFLEQEILTEEYERRRMTMAVSRLLIQAKNLLDNAALGIFPSLKAPAKHA